MKSKNAFSQYSQRAFLTQTPYDDMAREIGIRTNQLLMVLKRWRAEGIPAASALSSLPHWSASKPPKWSSGRSHPIALRRSALDWLPFRKCPTLTNAPAENWPWNLYTMVHAQTAPK